ncbi:MAG: hypothetical protein AB9834_06945 [Lentimicrobium sp.]
MSDINHENEDYKDLRQENEFMKMKLMLERGANFDTQEGSNSLDPSIENEFLKNIELFEAAYENSKMVKLYDFIGRPEFPAPDSISSDRIEEELDKLISFLNERDISLTTLCPVDPDVLYRFIVEELFETEKEDVHLEGVVSCYTYEDFHPNDEYNLGQSTKDFLNDLFYTGEDFYTYHLANDFADKQKLPDFRKLFASSSVPEVEINQIEIENDRAKVTAFVSVVFASEESTIEQKFTGECLLSFIHIDVYWYVSDIMLPLMK